jgi:hypothetical protein
MQPFSNSGIDTGALDAADATSRYPVSLLSMGWGLAASASVAMGMVDLSEMMKVQYFLFGCLVVSAFRFSIVLRGTTSRMEDDRVGSELTGGDYSFTKNNDVNWFMGPNPFQAVGPIMFNLYKNKHGLRFFRYPFNLRNHPTLLDCIMQHVSSDFAHSGHFSLERFFGCSWNQKFNQNNNNLLAVHKSHDYLTELRMKRSSDE